jgi:hypothetical protein
MIEIRKSAGHNPEFYFIHRYNDNDDISVYPGSYLDHSLSWTDRWEFCKCETQNDAEYLLKRWNHYDRLGGNRI